MAWGFIALFLVVLATTAVLANNSTGDCLDLNDYDDHLFFVKSLFGKLNTLLQDNKRITESLLDLNRRFEELNESDDTQRKVISKYLNQTQTWHTILRRQDGSENFNRTWDEYKNGFGNLNGEFFIGLDKLHAMTTYGPPQELLVTLKDFEKQTRYAKYNRFRIGSEVEKYAIMDLGEYSGDAGDSLRRHKGHKFSTHDQDNATDQDNDTEDLSCAKTFGSGWWFYNCYYSNLNGRYYNDSESHFKGVHWIKWKGGDHSLKYAEMMIR